MTVLASWNTDAYPLRGDDDEINAITNDIYTKEDQLILTRAHALPPDRTMGVETGGSPHTAIREARPCRTIERHQSAGQSGRATEGGS